MASRAPPQSPMLASTPSVCASILSSGRLMHASLQLYSRRWSRQMALMPYLDCLHVLQEILSGEVGLAHADVHIPCLVCPVLYLPALEVPHCLLHAAHMHKSRNPAVQQAYSRESQTPWIHRQALR